MELAMRLFDTWIKRSKLLDHLHRQKSIAGMDFVLKPGVSLSSCCKCSLSSLCIFPRNRSSSQ